MLRRGTMTIVKNVIAGIKPAHPALSVFETWRERRERREQWIGDRLSHLLAKFGSAMNLTWRKMRVYLFCWMWCRGGKWMHINRDRTRFIRQISPTSCSLPLENNSFLLFSRLSFLTSRWVMDYPFVLHSRNHSSRCVCPPLGTIN